MVNSFFFPPPTLWNIWSWHQKMNMWHEIKYFSFYFLVFTSGFDAHDRNVTKKTKIRWEVILENIYLHIINYLWHTDLTTLSAFFCDTFPGLRHSLFQMLFAWGLYSLQSLCRSNIGSFGFKYGDQLGPVSISSISSPWGTLAVCLGSLSCCMMILPIGFVHHSLNLADEIQNIWSPTAMDS